ncbi:S8 family serine peptidase [Haloparvum sp. PAK95]|uniref:S8 family serine peptidase n=1 Tax=Haloparvum sp. PAK95 TaxID=3418962 RepID=UPI003D2EECEA
MPGSDKEGEGVHIGILDSVGNPPEELKSGIKFEEAHDGYLSIEADDLIGHGTDVLDLAAAMAPRATFSTFQVTPTNPSESNQGSRRGAVISALNDVADTDIDLLNMSLGIPHECGGRCSLSRETRYLAKEDDVCPVVATGNRERAKRLGVHCPAICDEVLSVAGYMPYCGHEIVRGEESGQWWLESKNGETPTGIFCGQSGCCSGADCMTHRVEKPWGGNVSWHNSVPDVTAPPIHLKENGASEVSLQLGTSFSTPIVTGLLATALSDLPTSWNNLSALEIVRTASESSSLLDEGDLYKFDMGATRQNLAQRVNR